MFTVFVLLTGQLAAATVGPAAVRRWQMRALIGLAVILAAGAATARIASGAVWASPLSDLVWGIDAVMLVETIVALVLAIALGTPGCEVGVWPELIGRLRGVDAPASTRPICILGLHFIDEWEARATREPRPTGTTTGEAGMSGAQPPPTSDEFLQLTVSARNESRWSYLPIAPDVLTLRGQRIADRHGIFEDPSSSGVSSRPPSVAA